MGPVSCICAKSFLFEANLKENLFTGPDRKIISDGVFDCVISNLEWKVWISFKEVISKSLGNTIRKSNRNPFKELRH